MERHVSFRSARFEYKEPKPYFINPNCFGEDVAGWLVTELRRVGFTVDEPIQEDYGWGFWTKINLYPFWTAISLIESENEVAPETPEWYLSVVYETGCNPLRRFRQRPQSQDILTLCQTIDNILHSDPSIMAIQWWPQSFYTGTASPHP